MKKTPVTPADLSRSVIAVPPLARTPDRALAREPNRKLVRHLELGGVSTLMYGGNANFYNLPLAELADTLAFLEEAAGAESWVIPSAGPDYGRLMDSAPLFRSAGFPAVMALPASAQYTSEGVMTGLRRFHDAAATQLVLYLKQDNYLPVAGVRALIADGVVCAIKYAVVRSDPADDPYLAALVQAVDRRLVISGIGERPVTTHFPHFGLSSFTSGSVCVAPRSSTALLHALSRGDLDAAAAIREAFLPLENCRDDMGPVRVLHDAITLAGIAEMGPLLPLLSNLSEAERGPVRAAASALLAYDRERIAA